MTEPTQIIYVWAHGTWCYPIDISSFQHLSDDFAIVFLPEHYDDEMIEEWIDKQPEFKGVTA